MSKTISQAHGVNGPPQACSPAQDRGQAMSARSLLRCLAPDARRTAELAALRAEQTEARATAAQALRRVGVVEDGIEDVYRRVPRPPQPEPIEHERKLLRAADLGLVLHRGGAA